MAIKKIIDYIWASNFLFTIFVTIIVAMAIFPLPGWMIDSLIAISIISTFLLFINSLYMKEVTELESVPTMLLFMTFFRLSLSIATTRQILSGGDTGNIIVTFGEVVIGGSVVVGLVIFFVITIVQFLVVAKGSERVAEVAARFTLDAIPGKQMSIDADLRNGAVTGEQAREMRMKLEIESKFYGSMDGALKFVKGDSIAGMIIIFVNLLGGLATGVMLQDLSVGESFNTYAILTIGDGLTGQIPAIFTSLACGVIISRVDTRKTASHSIQTQLLSSIKAIQLAVVFCFVLALIPGFPVLPFMFIACALILVLYNKSVFKKNGTNELTASPNDNIYGSVEKHRVVISLFEGASDDLLDNSVLSRVRQSLCELSTELYAPLVSIDVVKGQSKKKLIAVRFSSVAIFSVIYRETGNLIKITKTESDERKWHNLVEPAVSNAIYNRYVYVLDENLKDLEAKSVHFRRFDNITEMLAEILLCIYRYRCSELLGIEETLSLNHHMESVDKEQAGIVGSNFSTHALNAVFRDHLDSGLSLRNIDRIYDSLIDNSFKESDSESDIIDKYRYAMRHEILSEHSRGTMVFSLIPVSNTLHEYSRRATQVNSHGDVIFNINPEVFDFVRRCIVAYLDQLPEDDYPLMVVVGDARRPFRKLMARMGIYTPVIMVDELITGIADMAKSELCAFPGRPDIQNHIINNGQPEETAN